MNELQRLLNNQDIVVDLLITLAIVAVGLWVIITLLNLPDRLSKKACPSCLRETRGTQSCPHCGGAF
jgi:hypothetical protein